MIKVTLTPKGVFISRVVNEMELFVDVYDDPKQLQVLIEQLQEAKLSLAEHLARSAEEGNNLWESV